jgi:uncharacterized membrane protein YdfJ with MMPL/SSD domain
MLDRISALTWRRPRAVLAAVLLFAAVAGFFGHDVEHHLQAAGFADPASQSERAGRVLADDLGYTAEPALVVLLRARDGGRLDLHDPAVVTEVNRLATQLAKGDYVGKVDNPLAAPDPAKTGLVAADGRSLVLGAHLTDPDIEDKGGIADESVRKLVTSTTLDVGYGGYAPAFNEVNDQTRKDLTNAELIAFPILGLLLLLVFRSRWSRCSSRWSSAASRSSAPSSRCGSWRPSSTPRSSRSTSPPPSRWASRSTTRSC